MDTPLSKINLIVSIVTETDEVTKPVDCPLVVYQKMEYIAIPVGFLKILLEKINTNEVGFAITNDFFPALIEEQNAVEWVDFIYLKDGDKLVKVFFKKILYIISRGDYTFVHTIDNKQLIAHISLEWFEQNAPDYFIIIHRSYFINMKMISHYIDNGRTGVVIMIDNKDLDVSQRMKDAFEEKSKGYMFSIFYPLTRLAKNILAWRK